VQPVLPESKAREQSTHQAGALEGEASALLERWAPSFAREVSAEHPERDRPLAIDFDGDWDATNNWDDLRADFARAPAVVYGSAILTDTHAFLTFTLFYPRDWFSPVCVPYICHDNDLEVLLLAVRRAPKPEQSELVFVETKAHFDYVAVAGGEVARDAAGHPWISVESEGHGMYPLRTTEPFPSSASTLVRRRVAGSSSARSSEAYALDSLYATLWAHRQSSATNGHLWISGESGFLGYAGARQGRLGLSLGASMAGRRYPGGVRPPWGLKAPAGERGDWFLDPAYVSFARHATWFSGAAPSPNYVWNPYLDDLRRECADRGCPFIAPASPFLQARTGVAGTLVLALGLGFVGTRKRVRARWPRVG
jgi:hypothetical protein